MRIRNAVPISRYDAPLYFIQVIDAPLDRVRLRELNRCKYKIIEYNLLGWYPYTHIIRVDDDVLYRGDYMVTLEQ